MKFKFKHVCAAAALFASGGVHAVTQTLPIGGSVQADSFTAPGGEVHPTNLTNLSGSLSWRFSSQFVSAMNVVKASLGEVGHADVMPAYLSTTSSTGVVTTRLASAVAVAPVVSLTGDFGEGQALIQQVASTGGVTFSTLKNGATNGAGSLQISNLKIDLSTGAVVADITGANGVGSLAGFHLWNYSAVTGQTNYLPPDFSGLHGEDLMGGLHAHGSNGFNGLFATTQGVELMAQALNFNALGRSALGSVNNPSKGGFGSLELDFSVQMSGPVAISLAVPEPSTHALLIAGALGLGLMTLRRKQ